MSGTVGASVRLGARLCEVSGSVSTTTGVKVGASTANTTGARNQSQWTGHSMTTAHQPREVLLAQSQNRRAPLLGARRRQCLPAFGERNRSSTPLTDMESLPRRLGSETVTEGMSTVTPGLVHPHSPWDRRSLDVYPLVALVFSIDRQAAMCDGLRFVRMISVDLQTMWANCNSTNGFGLLN